MQDRLHLQGLVCKVVWVLTLVQGTTDLQGKVCRVVWRVVCTDMAEYAQCSMDHWRMVVTSMEGSLHLQSMQSVHSMHSVQGGMDQWRGESRGRDYIFNGSLQVTSNETPSICKSLVDQ